MVEISPGTNTGTSGNDTFTISRKVGSFTVDGGAGSDTFSANLWHLPSSWSVSSIESVIFSGRHADNRFTFSASSSIVDLSGTTSTVVVTAIAPGMTIRGGRDTYLEVPSTISANAIVSLDMHSGTGSVILDPTQSNQSIQGTYLGLTGMISHQSNDMVFGGIGDDRVALGAGQNSFDGRDGLDKIGVVGTREEFTVSKTSAGFNVSRTSNPAGDITETSNVERVEYLDTSFNTIGQLAFDLDGSAGQTYRLYQTTFNRVPDEHGLSHNVRSMDFGLSIFDMANAFIDSEEFRNTYGTNISDSQFLTLLYQNVLNRAPDQVGLDGWLGRLGSGTERKEVLFGFSESAENKATVAPAIDDGIWLV